MLVTMKGLIVANSMIKAEPSEVYAKTSKRAEKTEFRIGRSCCKYITGCAKHLYRHHPAVNSLRTRARRPVRDLDDKILNEASVF